MRSGPSLITEWIDASFGGAGMLLYMTSASVSSSCCIHSKVQCVASMRVITLRAPSLDMP